MLVTFCVPCSLAAHCDSAILFFARMTSTEWMKQTTAYLATVTAVSGSAIGGDLKFVGASATLQSGGTTQAATPAPALNNSAATGCDVSWAPNQCRTSLVLVIAIPSVAFLLIVALYLKRRRNQASMYGGGAAGGARGAARRVDDDRPDMTAALQCPATLNSFAPQQHQQQQQQQMTASAIALRPAATTVQNFSLGMLDGDDDIEAYLKQLEDGLTTASQPSFNNNHHTFLL